MQKEKPYQVWRPDQILQGLEQFLAFSKGSSHLVSCQSVHSLFQFFIAGSCLGVFFALLWPNRGGHALLFGGRVCLEHLAHYSLVCSFFLLVISVASQLLHFSKSCKAGPELAIHRHQLALPSHRHQSWLGYYQYR